MITKVSFYLSQHLFLCCSAQLPCPKPYPSLHLSRRPTPPPSRRPIHPRNPSHSRIGWRWSAARRPSASPSRWPPIRSLSLPTPCAHLHPNRMRPSSTSSPRPSWTASVSVHDVTLGSSLEPVAAGSCLVAWTPPLGVTLGGQGPLITHRDFIFLFNTQLDHL